jgi:hypothetical protein
MPQITQIILTIATGDVEDAGTDSGNVYLGVCGREFRVDSEQDDFERGTTRTYAFGDNANVSDPELNDPREQLLMTENVELLPTYLRYYGERDHWRLQRAAFVLNGQESPQWTTESYLGRGIWLGTSAGMYVHIPIKAEV